MKTTRVCVNKEEFDLIIGKATDRINYDVLLLDELETSYTIYDYYDKPSNEKIEIFNYWRNWSYGIPKVVNTKLCVLSRNKFQFKLGIRVLTENRDIYIFIITKQHQYMLNCGE